METRCRNSYLELKHARAGTLLVTNLHWTMARRLLRELRDLTDLEFAELYAEANAERVRRLGPRADLDFTGAAATETGPTSSEGRKFFQCLIWYTRQGRAWHGTRRCGQLEHSLRVKETIISGYVDSDDTYFSGFTTFSRRSPCGFCIPDVWDWLVDQNPHLTAEDGERPAAEGSRQRARQRARAAGRHGAVVRWVEVEDCEGTSTIVAELSEGEDGR